MTVAMYCGQIGRSPLQLVADGFANGAVPRLAEWAGRRLVFTQNGRTAIALAARLWEVGKNDEILVPAFNCGSEVDPLLATGATVTMYRVSGSAQIDVGDLISRITPRTRIICVTHYFGWPMGLDEVAAVCAERQIKLIEDCALSLFSVGVGCAGDAAIFSLAKTLPACGGGILSLRNEGDDLSDLLQGPDFRYDTRAMLSLVKKWVKGVIGPRLSIRREVQMERGCGCGPDLPDMPDKYYWKPGATLHGPSSIAIGTLVRSDVHDVVRRRRENFVRLRQSLAGVRGINMLWEEPSLAEGICPLGLPILVEDRARWCAELNASGVVVSRWWEGYNRGLDWSEFPEARALKNRLVLLPVHQGLGSSQMDYIGDVARSLADRLRGV